MTKNIEIIYTEYHTQIEDYIKRQTGDKALAEDLTHDVFLKIIKNYEKFDDSKASIKTWIWTIARNTLTDYYRTRKIETEIQEGDIIADGIENFQYTDTGRDEISESLERAMECLDDRSAAIIRGRYFEGMSLKIIAGVLGIGYSNACRIHKKAIRTLRFALTAGEITAMTA